VDFLGIAAEESLRTREVFIFSRAVISLLRNQLVRGHVVTRHLSSI